MRSYFQTIPASLLVLCLARTVGGWGVGHPVITQVAFEKLPAWQQAIWAEQKAALIKDYCLYVDRYAGGKKELRPYVCLIDGRLYHYMPAARNRSFVTRGAEHFFTKIPQALKAGRIEHAAKMMGGFVHPLEDAGSHIHCLEGPSGGSTKFLNQLLPAPVHMPLTPAATMLSSPPKGFLMESKRECFEIPDYRLRLLGRTPAEASFHLYERYRDMLENSRAQLVPYIQACQRDDVGGAFDAMRAMGTCNAKLIADMFHTVLCMSRDRFDPGDVKALRMTDVTGVRPAAAPSYLWPPYRFTPIVPNVALDRKRNPVPLKLNEPEVNGEPVLRTFTKGFSMGGHLKWTLAYDLPRGVFSTFRCWWGLHPELSKEGKGTLWVTFGKAKVADLGTLTGDSPARRIEVDVRSGGRLTFHFDDPTKIWNNWRSTVVFGEPVLIGAD